VHETSFITHNCTHVYGLSQHDFTILHASDVQHSERRSFPCIFLAGAIDQQKSHSFPADRPLP
jgi:hypothetical protein